MSKRPVICFGDGELRRQILHIQCKKGVIFTSKFMYVCMYVYMYVCMYVRAYVCFVCMYVCMYVQMYVCM